MQSIEYCPEYCPESLDVEEYDPVFNWKIPVEFLVQTEPESEPEVPELQIDLLLNFFKDYQQVEQAPVVEEYDPVFNWKIPEKIQFQPAPVVEEYDPVFNWKIPEKIQFQQAPEPEQYSEPYVEPNVDRNPRPQPPRPQPPRKSKKTPNEKLEQAASDIRKFLNFYNQDLFNASSVYILRKAKVPVNRDTKRIAHQILREFQYDTFKITREDLEKFRNEKDLHAALKKYDKDIYNLSPIWLLRLAERSVKSIGDTIAAISTIDCYINH